MATYDRHGSLLPLSISPRPVGLLVMFPASAFDQGGQVLNETVSMGCQWTKRCHIGSPCKADASQVSNPMVVLACLGGWVRMNSFLL